MKDEIKEILDNLKNKDNDIKGINFLKYQDLTRGEIDLLLDYITNLQQEKEDYKSRLEKANNQLKIIIKNQRKQIQELTNNWNELEEKLKDFKSLYEDNDFQNNVKVCITVDEVLYIMNVIKDGNNV